MKKIILLLLGASLLCGCATTQTSITQTVKKDEPTPEKSFSGKKFQQQTPVIKRQSVSGTVCGDKDVSDDF